MRCCGGEDACGCGEGILLGCNGLLGLSAPLEIMRCGVPNEFGVPDRGGDCPPCPLLPMIPTAVGPGGIPCIMAPVRGGPTTKEPWGETCGTGAVALPGNAPRENDGTTRGDSGCGVEVPGLVPAGILLWTVGLLLGLVCNWTAVWTNTFGCSAACSVAEGEKEPGAGARDI